jgi:hypothetical protein
MIKPKTHFEQVPLELVKDIIGKQAEAGGFTAIETDVPALPKTGKGSFEKSGIAKQMKKERY